MLLLGVAPPPSVCAKAGCVGGMGVPVLCITLSRRGGAQCAGGEHAAALIRYQNGAKIL